MSRQLSLIVCVLLLLGACGFAAGLIGDIQGWWDGLGYASNVLADTTGACFGIPFVALILQRILRQEESYKTVVNLVTRARARQATLVAAKDRMFGNTTFGEVLVKQGRRIDDAVEQMRRLSLHRSPYRDLTSTEEFDTDAQSFETSVREIVESMKASDRYREYSYYDDWVAIQRAWRELDYDVLPRLADSGVLDWYVVGQLRADIAPFADQPTWPELPMSVIQVTVYSVTLFEDRVKAWLELLRQTRAHTTNAKYLGITTTAFNRDQKHEELKESIRLNDKTKQAEAAVNEIIERLWKLRRQLVQFDSGIWQLNKVLTDTSG